MLTLARAASSASRQTSGTRWCPHCGARLEVDYEDREGWISGDEYENEAECPVCEREFKLMCSMSIDYEAKTMESEDDGVLLG